MLCSWVLIGTELKTQRDAKQVNAYPMTGTNSLGSGTIMARSLANKDTDQGMLLGAFLRARRDALRPHEVGLPVGTRRRAPGLRREEVAQLCGISPTWYTWLEQGRIKGVSVTTLAAIARGLRLSQAERVYLFQLAARADPAQVTTGVNAHPLSALVQAVRTPAYVLDRHWDAVAWNRPAAQLFAHWLGPQAKERNLLRYVFLDPRAREFIVDWPERSQRLVAEYRGDTVAPRNDPARFALVRDLTAASAEFSSAWKAQRVYARDGGPRHFAHARRGRLAYEQYVMRLAENTELKMTVLVPAPSTG
jgi:transcriptional regulator with XRE-family HTH domain